MKTLIVIPTYNEKGNVEKLCEEILSLGLKDTALLFIDDNSPDGTGKILDNITSKYNNVFVLHRSSKLGIGSAHLDGINWAYKQNYSLLLTMDCDFTHPPSYIPKLIELSEHFDIIITSRYLMRESLKEWNLFRRFLTHTGHFLTKLLLGLEYDATGGFRLYNLANISQNVFQLIQSQGYSFFFESLFILHCNKYSITQIPINLPARTYGHSKMRLKDILQSVKFLFVIFIRFTMNKKKFIIIE